jgi:hypothetical protein
MRMFGSSCSHTTFVTLFLLAACGDADGPESQPYDAAATDAGCKFCLPHDASAAVQPADAGGHVVKPDANSCKLAEPPPCTSIACTWDDAQPMLPACAKPPLTPYYAARCGAYDALVKQGTDSVGYYIYDATGKLMSIRWLGLDTSCQVFDEAFTVPERCKMVTPKCPHDDDAGG